MARPCFQRGGFFVILGQLTGQVSQATTLTTSMRQQFDALAARIQRSSSRPSVYWELDATDPAKPYSVGPGSFVDDLITMAGGVNVFADTSSPYPQVGLEQVVAAQPEIIILADALYGLTPESVASRPGWEALPAVLEQRIYPIDDDLVSRPGPRTIAASRPRRTCCTRSSFHERRGARAPCRSGHSARTRRPDLVLALTTLGVLAIGLLSVGIGSVLIPPATALRILASRLPLLDLDPGWPETFATILLSARPLNLLLFDEEQAAQLGVAVERTKLTVSVAATLITAAAVAFSDLIAFVELLVPHAARLLAGPDHRRLRPSRCSTA